MSGSWLPDTKHARVHKRKQDQAKLRAVHALQGHWPQQAHERVPNLAAKGAYVES